MTGRLVFAILGFAPLLVGPSSASAVKAAELTDRWNIVLVSIDDLGWKDLGFMGSDFYETPRVDRLASEGMVFTDFYANAPNCAPSRACLMTGLSAPRHGIYTVASAERGPSRLRKLIPTTNTTTLDPRFVTIAEALQADGYTTGMFGKWHLGGDPKTQGFDVAETRRPRVGNRRTHFFPPEDDRPLEEGVYLSDHLAERAVDFIDEHQDEPFFLYLPHHAVHTPLEATEEVVAKYRSKEPGARHSHAVYAAMIDLMDQAVGRVLDALEARGLADRTVVIFLSDNGGYGPATSMHPLRGSKGMLYEGGIRVPLVVRWPGVVEPGSTSDEPVIGLDFYPTLLEIAEAPLPDGVEPDGLSLVPLLDGSAERLDRDALFWHFPAYLEGYQATHGPFRITPASAIRSRDWKLLEFFEDGRVELYNLARDIGETRNVIEEQPEVARQLLDRLHAWRDATDAPVPTEPNPDFDPEARLEAERQGAEARRAAGIRFP